MITLADFHSEFQTVKEHMRDAVLDVLSSGNYILGPKVREFEDVSATRLGIPCALGVANGTDALLLALEALQIGKGDEVITTPFSFFATVECIVRVGAKPVFVDIEPDTYNLNPEQLEAAITDKTKAIIPVHLFGQCADMDPILEIAHRQNAFVIEDACQAFGADYKGTPAGAIGDVGCFSFYPTKNLGAFGDAGLLVTKHAEVYRRASQLRNHGSTERYIHWNVGVNSRLDEVQAAVLLVKLQVVDEWTKRRIAIADEYTQALSGIYQTPVVRPHGTHVYHQYSVRHPEREKVRAFLADMGIQTQVYYPVPLHLQPVFGSTWRVGDFPIAERVANEIFSIPVHPMLTAADVSEVIQALQEIAVDGP